MFTKKKVSPAPTTLHKMEIVSDGVSVCLSVCLSVRLSVGLFACLCTSVIMCVCGMALVSAKQIIIFPELDDLVVQYGICLIETEL